jgi:Plant transposon protein
VLFSRWHILHRPARGWHIEEVLDILITCCVLHNMMIADGEEFGEGIQIGTRNIVSFDETAPESNVVLFSPAETRQAKAEHWRQTADLVEDSEQHFLLKNAISSHLWNKHGSG